MAVLLTLALLALAPAATAEVTGAAEHGFTSRNVLTVAAPPAEVFAALVQDVGQWWHPSHTFSGDAANLRIDARPQGCFCETLPDGGGARHMTVVSVLPGKQLRLVGGLGPLQGIGVDGALTWDLAPAGEGDGEGDAEGTTTVTVTYAVHGYDPQGLDRWAPVVDGVIRQQLERLGRHVAAGSPEPAGQGADAGTGTSAPIDRLDLRVSPLADFWFYVRAKAASGDREPVEPWLVDLVAAVQELERGLRSEGMHLGWVDPQLREASTVEELRQVFEEVPSLSASKGAPATVTEPLAVVVERLAATWPRFLAELWPAHEEAILAARARLEEELLPVAPRAYEFILRSLAMEDPERPIPVYLNARGPWPEAQTYRTHGGGSVSFVGVLKEDHRGTLLAEIVLHESHHALVLTTPDERSHVLARLRDRLARRGASRDDLRTLPHNVMFFQSAETVRRFVDPDHRDYGYPSDYYERAAHAHPQREIWLRHLGGEIDLDRALQEMADLAGEGGEE